jgi:ribosomal protein S18 acetylase RimI-like enzyme
VRVSQAGIFTFGNEELVIDEDRPSVGRAVCVVSGHRFAFRRVLAVRGRTLVLRGDVAPFEDVWEGDVVGCVVPRVIDRAAAVTPDRWTRTGWQAAVAYAHALATTRRYRRPRPLPLRTELLVAEQWPMVRTFWLRACGRELPLQAQERQHVIGLFDGDALVGANIYLAFGATAFSAFTLVDRSYRGMGGGNAMLAHAVREAERRGFESMYVHINVRNLPSIAAYERAGFVRKGWWSDPSDPLASAERQWVVFERDFVRQRDVVQP